MSIAEKLVTIAENQQAVYDAGYLRGKESGGGGDYDAGYTEGYQDGEETGIEMGKQAEYDRFWDTYQNYGNRGSYEFAFSNDGWTDEMFMPKYDIIPLNSADGMFAYQGYRSTTQCLTNIKGLLEKAGVTLDTSQSTAMSKFCYLAKSITHLPKISHESCTKMESTFWQSALYTIDELALKADGTNTFGTDNWNKPFNGCWNLQHMIVSGTIGTSGFNVGDCSKLDHDSLMSIINALQTKTSGTWTVTLGTTNLAKLTDAEKAIATQKGWTLA